MSVVSSSIWAWMSSISSARASGGNDDDASPDMVSRSMLVRSEVSGVRSSWLASATSCRWRTRDASRETSSWLNAVASRATSSSPSTGRAVKSSVRATRSTAVVSRRTGRRPLLATSQPASPAVSTPKPPNAMVTQPSRARIRSWSSSGCAITSASPVVLGRHRDDPVAVTVDAEGAEARVAVRPGDVELGAAELDVRALVEHPTVAVRPSGTRSGRRPRRAPRTRHRSARVRPRAGRPTPLPRGPARSASCRGSPASGTGSWRRPRWRRTPPPGPRSSSSAG